MMQRILNSKNLVAFALAAATGMTLYFRVLFPEGNIFLRVIALRAWQRTLLAAGLHQSGEIHHPSSQGRLLITKTQAALDTTATRKPNENKSQSGPNKAVLEH